MARSFSTPGRSEGPLMPSRRVRAAAVQMSPVLFDGAATVDKVVLRVGEAAAQGAELVVFPETVVPYYPYFSFIKAPAAFGVDHVQLIEQSISVPSPATDAMGAAARQAGAVVAVGVN